MTRIKRLERLMSVTKQLWNLRRSEAAVAAEQARLAAEDAERAQQAVTQASREAAAQDEISAIDLELRASAVTQALSSLQQAEANLRTREEEKEQRQTAVKETHRDVRALERLRDRHVERVTRESQSREQKELDDVSQRRSTES